jgi:hypothetical protein
LYRSEYCYKNAADPFEKQQEMKPICLPDFDIIGSGCLTDHGVKKIWELVKSA